MPRGFAVVHSESPGTGLSTGLPDGRRHERDAGPKAVVDWLNGRAKGYTTIDGDDRGHGLLVDGQGRHDRHVVQRHAADLAPRRPASQGLEAIIPIAPNTSYYHYYRSNGLVRNPGGFPGEDIDFLFDYINSGDPTRRQYCIDTVREAPA